MLVWGSGSDTKDLGMVEKRHCDACEKERPFKLFLQYRFAHIWYLFSWVTKKEYLLLCDVCRRGVQLDKKKVESKLRENPIPLRRRYGWMLLVVLIAIGAVLAQQSVEADRARDYAYIDSPHVNDLYVTDLSRVLRNVDQSPMYSVMKIKSVNGGRVEFMLSRVGYNKSSGPNKDIRSGKAASADYYTTESLVLPVSELRILRQVGTINSIRRD